MLALSDVLTISRRGYTYADSQNADSNPTPPSADADAAPRRSRSHVHRRVLVPRLPEVSSTAVSSHDPYQGFQCPGGGGGGGGGGDVFLAASLHPAVQLYLHTHRLYGFSREAVRTVCMYYCLLVCV